MNFTNKEFKISNCSSSYLQTKADFLKCDIFAFIYYLFAFVHSFFN